MPADPTYDRELLFRFRRGDSWDEIATGLGAGWTKERVIGRLRGLSIMGDLEPQDDRAFLARQTS